jgi:hypothetical protein
MTCGDWLAVPFTVPRRSRCQGLGAMHESLACVLAAVFVSAPTISTSKGIAPCILMLQKATAARKSSSGNADGPLDSLL